MPKLITKKDKQIAKGKLLTLNNLVKKGIINATDAQKLLQEILKTDIELWKSVKFTTINKPTDEQLAQNAKKGDIFLLKKYKRIAKLLSEDDIKKLIKANITDTKLRWIPPSFLKRKHFRKYIYSLNKPHLNKIIIRYMTIDEIQQQFPGNNKANKIYDCPHSRKSNIVVLVENHAINTIQNIIFARPDNTAKIRSISDGRRMRLKIILDINIELSYFPIIIPKIIV